MRFILFFLCVMFSFTSCADEIVNQNELISRLVTNVVIPPVNEVTLGTEFTIKGNNFQEGDVISVTDGQEAHLAQVVGFSKNAIVITLPAGLVEEKLYFIKLSRGAQEQQLGKCKFIIKLVSNVNLSEVITAEWGAEVAIAGLGFTAGDNLVISQKSGTMEVPSNQVSKDSIWFTIPKDCDDGHVTLYVKRGAEQLELGKTYLLLSIDLQVADRPYANVKGKVYSNGLALAGVVVSDGESVAVTDETGSYWLNSAKGGSVLSIAAPAGYQPERKKGISQFFVPLTAPVGSVEQHNFRLYKEEQGDFTFLLVTDMHLANRNTPKDYIQFEESYVKELSSIYNNSSKKVFAINCGDFSWDQYWYENNYDLGNCVAWYDKFDFPTFTAMGNHDNDPYIVDDLGASAPFVKTVNPRYYGFNYGEVQFIILDNVIWNNVGASQGVVGSRSYTTGIDATQLRWLQAYVSHLDPQKSTFVAFHIPAISYTGVSGGKYVPSSVVSGMTASLNLFSNFKDVHLLTGHTHISRNVNIKGIANHMQEHNVVGVCGTWWWTHQYTASNNNVSTDGTPGGYKVFEVSGSNVSWYQKGFGLDKRKQFMTYDMNSVRAHWENDATAQKAWNVLSGRRTEYANTENQVFINVWAFEQDSWKISVKENGVALAVTPVWHYDPLHTLSYDIPRAAATQSVPNFVSVRAPHLYMVQASSATSSLEIEVEDGFGNKYTETMSRPKELTTYVE